MKPVCVKVVALAFELRCVWARLQMYAIIEEAGNLHVGQKFRQVRCPTGFDISIKQHSTHENTTQWSKQERHKPCPMVGAIMLALELPHTKELSKTKA